MHEALALGKLKEISQTIQTATFFTIMADETADVSNKDILVVCMRIVLDGALWKKRLLSLVHPTRPCPVLL